MTGAPLEKPSRRAAAVDIALAGLLVAASLGCASARRPALDLGESRWNRVVSGLGLDPAAIVSPVHATRAMRQAALQYAGAGFDKERLDRLHAALLDRRDFGFENDTVGTFTAAETFEARRGNCVSFANLLIAMARSIGISVQAALLVPRGSAERKGGFVRSYTHLVVVHRRGQTETLYHFYPSGIRVEAGRDLRLIDDLEIAAISLSNRAVSALEDSDLAAAQDHLEKAMLLGPELPDLHANLGLVLWRKGDVPAALASFRKGLEIDPHRAVLLHNLAALYVEQGRVEEARAALATASSQQASPFLLVVKGDLEYAGGDLPRALRSYRKAHAKDRALLAPLLRIARTERALGHTAAAQKALEKARRLSPEDEEVRELLEPPR